MSKIYNVNNLSFEEFSELVRSGDCTKKRQLRVTEEGVVEWSYDYVNLQNLNGIACRFPTFDPIIDNNATLENFNKTGKTLYKPFVITGSELENMYKELMENWAKGCPKKRIDRY